MYVCMYVCMYVWVCQVRALVALFSPEQVKAALVAVDANGNTALTLAFAQGSVQVCATLWDGAFSAPLPLHAPQVHSTHVCDVSCYVRPYGADLSTDGAPAV